MSNSTSTLKRTAAKDLQHSSANVYSREQQEQLLILQAEVELLLVQIQTQAAQPATAA
jgi:hypothetical protein